MSARWWTLLVWALAVASAVFWGFKVLVKAPPAPAQTQTAEPTRVASGDLTRLLGADPPPPATADASEPAAEARFHLIGVVTPRSAQAAREGLALIAVDGRPARTFRVGAVVDGQTVLKSVAARGATLGAQDGGAVMALNLPPLAPAATGVLPAVANVPQTTPPMPQNTMTPPPTPMVNPTRPASLGRQPGYTPPQTMSSPGPTLPRRSRGRTTQPEPDQSAPPSDVQAPDGTLTR